MSRLILEHIIVFTNDYYSNLDRIEFNQAEFTSSWAHLTPLIMSLFIFIFYISPNHES
jgi:hypothetical protein